MCGVVGGIAGIACITIVVLGCRGSARSWLIWVGGSGLSAAAVAGCGWSERLFGWLRRGPCGCAVFHIHHKINGRECEGHVPVRRAGQPRSVMSTTSMQDDFGRSRLVRVARGHYLTIVTSLRRFS